jgi:hypothetical protein
VSSSTTPERRRNPALVTVDIIAAVAVLIFALLFGLVVLGFVNQFGSFGSACGTGPYTGLECNATVLGIATYSLLTITVVAFFLGLGMAVVRIIQKRLVFPWPLGALVVMILAFYLGAYVAGLTVPAS